MIVAHNGNRGDGQKLLARARRERIKLCETHDDWFDVVCASTARLGLIDIDEWPVGATQAFARRAIDARISLPLIVRCELTPKTISELPLLSLLPLDVRVSLRQYDDLDALITDAAPGVPLNANTVLLRAITPTLSKPVAPIVIAAIVLGERRIKVAVVSSAIGTSARKVRERLADAQLPPLSDLLASFLCVHAIHRIASTGLGAKVVASMMGFEGVAALDMYVYRHTGARRAVLARSGGVELLVSRVEAIFRNALCGLGSA